MKRVEAGEARIDGVTLAAAVATRQMCAYAIQQAKRNGERVLPFFHEVSAGWAAVTADAPAAVAVDGRRSTDIPSECVVTVATAAGLLGRSDRTVLRWLQDGRLKGERLGRVWVIDSRSIDQHLEETHAA